MDEMVKKLYSTTNAMVWAEEFNKVQKELYWFEVDEGWLLGWFANAIEKWRSAEQSYIIKNWTVEDLEREKKLYKDIWLMD